MPWPAAAARSRLNWLRRLRVEAREVVVVGAVAGVLPVVLHGAAAEEAVRFQGARLVFGRKEHVHRRAALVPRPAGQRGQQGAAQLRLVFAGGHQEPARGERREGQAHQQLGVVLHAQLLGGVGPAEVVDVLAHRVVLAVGGHGRHQGVPAPEREVRRLPAARGRRRARGLHGVDPFPAQHRRVVRTQQRVPRRLRRIADRLEQPKAGLRHGRGRLTAGWSAGIRWSGGPRREAFPA